MRYFRFFFLVFGLFSFIAGCGTETSPPSLADGQFSNVESVPSINIETLNSRGGLLLTGTNQGAYKKQLDQPGEGWKQAGLAIDSATVADFVIWNEQEVLATIMYLNGDERDDEKPDIFKSTDGVHSWQPTKATYKFSDGVTAKFAPDKIELEETNPSNLFSPSSISVDSGKTWSALDSEAGAFPEFITVSDNHPGYIWAGGSSYISTPNLGKSENRGVTWTSLTEQVLALETTNGQGSVYDATLHPDRPKSVLVGYVDGVIKTTNGGESFKAVFTEAGIMTLAQSVKSGLYVYAAGGKVSGLGTLEFYASGDFGDTWETVTMPDSPAGVQVNDMVSVMEDGQEVLYLGTNKGLYSYRFEE